MMDQIFKEEQAKLDEVERRIDAEVDNYKNLHDKLDAEISYAVGHETEDYYIRRDLILCSWYYKRLASPDTYLNIDEAQDISIAEYTLLREILGKDCIFNLYGDINQSLFPEKSIMEWEDLRYIVSDKVFVLNEDYRNTLQITEYCNQAFSAEIYPIGITGEEVYEMDTRQAIQWLMEIKHTNPTYRTAVILHEEKASKKKELSEMFGEEKISWYAVDDKRISVLSVENAKGLEFEAVVVLSEGMEMNELYIAYTRALDHLCVVSGCRTVRHTRLLESEDHTDQLFGSMGNGYIVVFTLSLLFGKIASER